MNDSVARIAGEARKPKLHTVAEAWHISRKPKRLGLLAVQSVPVQRQEEEPRGSLSPGHQCASMQTEAQPRITQAHKPSCLAHLGRLF